MCDPGTLGVMAIASTALSTVGAGVSAFGQYQQASYQSRVEQQNARLAADRSRDALRRGQIEAERYGREASREQGALRASMAANNIDPGYGSAADVRGDAATYAAQDIETIRENAAREAWGFEVDAMNSRARARSYRGAATGALVGGAFGMATTALGGAVQYRNMFPRRR